MKKNTSFIVLSNLISMTLASIIVNAVPWSSLSGNAEKVMEADLSPSTQPQGNLLQESTKTNESILSKEISVQSGPSSASKYTKMIPTYDQWVSADAGIYVRSEPSLNATIIMRTPAQSVFPLIKQNGKWDLIQLGMNQTGWIADTVVQKRMKTNQIQLMQVKPNTKLWDGPDDLFTTVGEANLADSYIPIEVSGRWVHLLSEETGQSSWTPVDSIQWKSASADTQLVSGKSVDGHLQGKTIVIDPGHGGNDTGTIGTKQSIYERDVNLAVADLLANKLRAEGAHVILTRQSNDTFVSLAERAKISNDNHADAFISIHQNAYPKDPSVSGTSIYYDNPKTSQTLAKSIEQAVNDTEHEKMSANDIKQEELAVLHLNNQPAVLVEGCFLSNPGELKQSVTPEWEDKLASGIFRGLLNYLGQNLKSGDNKGKV